GCDAENIFQLSYESARTLTLSKPCGTDPPYSTARSHPRRERTPMPRQDTVDFLTAFAVGAVLGIGATLLLQPDNSPKDRVVKQLKPYRKQMRRSYKHFSRGLKEGSGATSELTSEVIGAGRELLA